MKASQKILVTGLFILFTTFFGTSCSPNAESPVPTQAIRVINIQKVGITNPVKVYVQLANGESSDPEGGGNVAEGSKILDSPTQNEITIPLHIPGDVDTPFISTGWKNELIIVSPSPAIGYESIAVRANRTGPSSSGTVVIDLTNEISFKYNDTTPPSITPPYISVSDYQLLYDNLVKGDPDINP